MSVEEAFQPEPASEAAEALRRTSADYKETFGTVVGERVFQHLMTNILHCRTRLMRRRPDAELSPNDALYLVALKDAAEEIRGLMEMEFRDDPRPVVRHNRFTSRPAGR